MARPKNNENLPYFCRKITELRKERHLTQPEAAEAMGCTREMIAYYEGRAQNPTLEVVKEFAKFYQVSADELIFEEAAERKKQGPDSILETKIQQLRQLPRSQQKTVIKMLDGLLES